MRVKAAGFGNKSSYAREIKSLATSGGKFIYWIFPGSGNCVGLTIMKDYCIGLFKILVHNRGSLALKWFALVVIRFRRLQL